MKNLFRKNKDHPQPGTEEKWYVVGFFSALLLSFILVMPIFVLTGEIRDVVELSTSWFILMIALIVWVGSWLFTKKWWLNLSHNFGLYMYRASEKTEEKKKKKLTVEV